VEPAGSNGHVLSTFGRVAVRFTIEVQRRIQRAHHGIALYGTDRQLLWGTATDNVELGPGLHHFLYEFPSLPLKPGSYAWRVSLFDAAGQIDDWDCLPEMVVATPPVTHPRDEWAGILNIPVQFSVEPAEVQKV
jgi:hypothetical protein